MNILRYEIIHPFGSVNWPKKKKEQHIPVEQNPENDIQQTYCKD